jgi:hypothetical protein
MGQDEKAWCDQQRCGKHIPVRGSLCSKKPPLLLPYWLWFMVRAGISEKYGFQFELKY